MGYKPEKKIYRITFPHRGDLEVRMRSTSIGNLQSIMGTDISALRNAGEAGIVVIRKIAKLIVSWNIIHPEVDEDDSDVCSICGVREDEPVPATEEGLRCIEIDLMIEIIQNWGLAIQRVSAPKGMNSSDGAMNTEELMLQLAEMQNL
jgi:hypothetical protein